VKLHEIADIVFCAAGVWLLLQPSKGTRRRVSLICQADVAFWPICDLSCEVRFRAAIEGIADDFRGTGVPTAAPCAPPPRRLRAFQAGSLDR